jgi:hypothetical protein
MDITVLFQRFAEQSPLIILCGLIIWQLLKMYKEEKAMLRTERLERQQEIRELIDKHTQELKELNEYTRTRDLETQEALTGTVTAVESIHQLINQKFRLLD